MRSWMPAAAALVLLAAGCSSVANYRGMGLSEAAVHVRGVPPLRQDAGYSCGPVCVAAVAAHWGVDVAEFRSRNPQGPGETSARELQALAGSVGLRAFAYEGGMPDLRDNLGKGRPVIVMLPKPPDPAWRGAGLLGKLALAAGERLGRPPHWVVVVGLTGNGDVVVHDPASGLLSIRRSAFEEWWKRMGNQSVLVVKA